jgi:hypothetical protein
MACMTAFSNSLRIGPMEVWHIMTATISSLGSTRKCVPETPLQPKLPSEMFASIR